MRHIVTLSGGITSAWVANWVIENVDRNAELIFTDPKWEHHDLYRFLHDLENYWGRKITWLEDGRTPEQLFYDQGILGNNRMPVCSRLLKGKVLQDYLKSIDDDITLYFGIDFDEQHRSVRIKKIYDEMGIYTRFPLIELEQFLMKDEQRKEIKYEWGIEPPELYNAGFAHNNCSGGCVRQGKKSWLVLLKQYPEVYAERERVEREFSKEKGSNYTFLKDSNGEPLSLERLRKDYEKMHDGEVSLFPEDEPCMCFEV
jgi:3'-phosphoadenosine 5'-phosphosulfate sulfotransferase (PAPS reductase)/FAD synthetase